MGVWGVIIFLMFGFGFFYVMKNGSLKFILAETIRGLKNTFMQFQNEGWITLKESLNELWERFQGRNK